jgi:hypothetical protein
VLAAFPKYQFTTLADGVKRAAAIDPAPGRASRT